MISRRTKRDEPFLVNRFAEWKSAQRGKHVSCVCEGFILSCASVVPVHHRSHCHNKKEKILTPQRFSRKPAAADFRDFGGNAGRDQEGFPVLPGVSRMTDMVMREQTTKMTSRAMAIPFQFL